jgi:HEAT repeat protein
MKRICLSLTLLAVSFAGVALAANRAAGPQARFTPVDGPSLKAKLDAAARLARANNAAGRYWTAYQFDVRPGVAVDAEWRDGKGVTHVNGVSVNSNVETRNLGVFLLREGAGEAITRVEVYNLDRQREYSGYPVFWLGRAGSQESLDLLKELADAGQGGRQVADHAVMAIGLHDDARVAALLEGFVRQSKSEQVRKSAVFWLGQVDGANPLLAELVRDEKEATEVRKQAAFAIGVSKNAAALPTLQNLFSSVSSREVKKQLVFAASINESKDEAVDFLIRVAGQDPDREVKKQALFWLGQKAGERSRAALGNVVESNDADTEVQKQAVFAISQRPKDEAVPMLIKIARTHQKPEVRKQAIFWLGQTGDERALEFFKEVLAK